MTRCCLELGGVTTAQSRPASLFYPAPRGCWRFDGYPAKSVVPLPCATRVLPFAGRPMVSPVGMQRMRAYACRPRCDHTSASEWRMV